MYGIPIEEWGTHQKEAETPIPPGNRRGLDKVDFGALYMTDPDGVLIETQEQYDKRKA